MLESLTQRRHLGPVLRRTSQAASFNRQSIYLPSDLAHKVAARLDAMHAARWVNRLWNNDASLWTGADEAEWTGWVDPARQEANMRRYLGMCSRLRESGSTDVVLIGMGGASLGAHVLQSALGSAADGMRLHVLDSNDPDQVLALQRRLPPEQCLYVIASKSGSTMESTLLAQRFYAMASQRLGKSAARRFCAITDAGTPLQQFAEEQCFAAIFTGDRTIGGRYSVLSPFGLVPLALLGHDPMEFLRHAGQLRKHCSPRAPINSNPGALLGAILGEAALAGRDKVTLWVEPELSGMADWLEQLLAESTGKAGQGLIPVTQEPPCELRRYSPDRLFVILRRSAALTRQRDALRAAGQPVIDMQIGTGAALAQEFYRWQYATAVAASILGVNPFDQPDVEASKLRTRELLNAKGESGTGRRLGSLVIDTGDAPDLATWLNASVARYFALLAYLPGDAQNRNWLSIWQGKLRDHFGAAATAGFGPRYLHSCGQLHKGGPDGGAYLMIGRHATDGSELGICQNAQSRADLAELRARGRHCAAVWFTGDIGQGLRELGQLLESCLLVNRAAPANPALLQ